jgi:hypothetical protein
MRTLNEILLAMAGLVDDQKLLRLRQKLEAAVGDNLAEVQLTDAIKIRHQLAVHLKAEGASRGIVQSFEQFFMGVIRRAALMGLTDPPPEGPWSLGWLRVLDSISSDQPGRSVLRSLAAWATARGLEPDSITEHVLREWSATFSLTEKENSVRSVLSVLARAQNVHSEPKTSRRQRLALKASVGSVRDFSNLYGLPRKSTKRVDRGDRLHEA